MAEDFLTRFAEWQNYMHYILLTLALVVYMNFAGIKYFNDIKGMLQLLLVIFVMDTLVHLLFWSLPKKNGLQWRS